MSPTQCERGFNDIASYWTKRCGKQSCRWMLWLAVRHDEDRESLEAIDAADSDCQLSDRRRL